MSVMDAAQTSTEKARLRLPSLEIRNFRAFDHLRIESLGRVNLITGRNNVGKTTVLEAAYLFARRGAGLPLYELLRSRDEFEGAPGGATPDVGWSAADERELSVPPITIRHLFHGRKEFDDFPEPIRIGPIGELSETLQMDARWYRAIMERSPEGVQTQKFVPLSPDDIKSSIDPIPQIAVRMGGGSTVYYSLTQLSDRRSYLLRMGGLAQDKHALFVKACGLESALLSRLWNNVQLSPQEDDVRAALQIIAPDVERVSIRIDQGAPLSLIPIVKVKGSSQPVPLRTMGDGMVRLFAIAVALVNMSEGFLLIDEIENGLHYSIQPEVWRLIFRVASRLNVQVLATTHSWDCIEAFQKASVDSESADGMLVRLEALRGKVVATSFDREDLPVITRDYLEVR